MEALWDALKTAFATSARELTSAGSLLTRWQVADAN